MLFFFCDFLVCFVWEVLFDFILLLFEVLFIIVFFLVLLIGFFFNLLVVVGYDCCMIVDMVLFCVIFGEDVDFGEEDILVVDMFWFCNILGCKD